jgi:chromosomal replication initiation ATPase DnaA
MLLLILPEESMAGSSSIAKLPINHRVGSAVAFNGIARPIAHLISVAVSSAFMVPIGELHADTRRTASIALARQSAMYLAHVAFRMNFTEAGRAFGRARTTAARACSTIEERREEPTLDAMLADLEHALRRDAAPRAAS